MLAAFWRREFDLESQQHVDIAVAGAGLNLSDWHAYLEGQSKTDLTAAIEHAELLGVFGAPTFIYKDEMFWGGDRLNLLAAALDFYR